MTSTTPDIGTTHRAGSGAEHWELVRALGAFALTPPPGSAGVCRALDLVEPTGSEHTQVFVLGAPPHAAIHLGPQGQLGGEGLDRVSGFWRALGLRAPEDADHLGALLMLYAELGATEHATDDDRLAAQLCRSREVLLHEHLWSWAPGYLHAVAGLGVPTATEWAELTYSVLARAVPEVSKAPGASALPLALRCAPPALTPQASAGDLLDAMVTPIRSGVVLSQRDLQEAAAAAGLGFRRGERRYALRAMLEQDSRATVAWAAATARSWVSVHEQHGTDAVSAWWRERAAATATALDQLLDGEE